MPSHTRLAVALVLVVVLVLAGCSGSGGGGAGGGNGSAGNVELASGSGGGVGSAGESAAGGGRAAGSAQTGNPQALQRQRARIKTGHVRLDVENVTRTQRNVTAATRRLGGYVSGSSVETRSENGENVSTGRLVLRVPSQNFSALYSRVRNAGTVLSARTNTTDVSDRLVDLRARLNNLRAQRQRLRNLYANASDTGAVLKVQKRLSNVQSRIEQLQAQLKSLRGQIAYSTITVELSESAPEPRTEAWYDTGVLGAFLASVGGVLTTLRAVVVALAYLAPYLLVFGLPAGAVGYLAYRRRGKT
jgi:hypothetical protein